MHGAAPVIRRCSGPVLHGPAHTSTMGSSQRSSSERACTGVVLNVADLEPNRVRPLLRSEYDRLVVSGAFFRRAGRASRWTPGYDDAEDAAHAYTVERLGRVLTLALADRA